MANRSEYKMPDTLKQLMKCHPATGKKTTLKELANYVGVRQQTLSQYVKGETEPSPKHFLAMADFFGVSADYLLTGREDNSIYVLMAASECRWTAEQIKEIADLCSLAKDKALSVMECIDLKGRESEELIDKARHDEEVNGE